MDASGALAKPLLPAFSKGEGPGILFSHPSLQEMDVF